jgi:hypothetical protein
MNLKKCNERMEGAVGELFLKNLGKVISKEVQYDIRKAERWRFYSILSLHEPIREENINLMTQFGAHVMRHEKVWKCEI